MDGAGMETPAPADLVAAWAKLRAHLDSLPLDKVAGALGIRRFKAPGGQLAPYQCPRYECRNPKPVFDANGWACPLCLAGGAGAALFTAHVAGWTSGEGDDEDQVRADFERLAVETLLCGLVDDTWTPFFHGIPGSAEWGGGRRGIFEGDDRGNRVLLLARSLRKTDMVGLSILRVCWAWSCAFCKPPLNARELAAVVSRAAEER